MTPAVLAHLELVRETGATESESGTETETAIENGESARETENESGGRKMREKKNPRLERVKRTGVRNRNSKRLTRNNRRSG